jgi:hypothetical protein
MANCLANIQLTACPSGATQRHANYFELAKALEQGQYPHSPLPHRTIIRGGMALHLSRDPNMKMSIGDAATKFNLEDLHAALAEFLSRMASRNPYIIGGRRMANVNDQLPFNDLQIWTKVHLQSRAYHAPHDILPSQTVNASPPLRPWTFGHSDVVLVNHD